ncbi:MAG: hypothetical protein K2K91_04090 [Ruminococcus sp.]|nr:hypothetical protein [Ruminococcus sp.]MDE7099272.1 hypothetical protein [Ruminococcus sp.]
MIKKIISVIMVVGVLASLTACGDKTQNSDSREQQATEPYQLLTENSEDAETVPPTTEVIAAADGPRLYMGNTTAKAGEYADVTLYVENAEMKWTMCGIHMTYPDILEPEMLDVEERLVQFTRGNASNYSTASVAMLWVNNLPKELTSKNLGCVFFTEVFNGDKGLDGDIMTFRVKIPDDAESGTVYPLGFYYMDSDKFINDAKDLSLQKYAFENWTEGSITVE